MHRCLNVLAVSSLSLLLAACSHNSRFDDNHYRPLGQIEPVNPRQASSPASPSPRPAPAPQRYSADGYDENELTALRYGHAGHISRILQTAKIHCAPRTLSLNTASAEIPGISLCHYQFPRHCGSHSFTLIEAPEQVALVYHDHVNRRSIVDQIMDRQYARPGLWDLSDKLSVASAFPERQIAEQFRTSQWRDWVIDMNSEDRSFYGTVYARAINEVQACF